LHAWTEVPVSSSGTAFATGNVQIIALMIKLYKTTLQVDLKKTQITRDDNSPYFTFRVVSSSVKTQYLCIRKLSHLNTVLPKLC